MNFQERRGPRGASRATPEEMLREAITWHRAITERERWQAAAAAAPIAPHKSAPWRQSDDEVKRRAQFAEAVARAAFGRFYRKDPRK
jgi:hypothetical protein